MTNDAIYLTVDSPADDTLVAASVDPDIAATATFHETMSMCGERRDTAANDVPAGTPLRR